MVSTEVETFKTTYSSLYIQWKFAEFSHLLSSTGSPVKFWFGLKCRSFSCPEFLFESGNLKALKHLKYIRLVSTSKFKRGSFTRFQYKAINQNYFS